MGSDGLYDALLTGYGDMAFQGCTSIPRRRNGFIIRTLFLTAGNFWCRAHRSIPGNETTGRKTVAVEFASSGDTEAALERRLHSLSIHALYAARRSDASRVGWRSRCCLVETISARFFLKNRPA
jgi:ABC-type amino acid transport substrate-binding protein